jgi:N utilization substance protein A
MSATIAQSIDALCKEHGIDRELVIEAVKDAVRAAARKHFKSGEDLNVEWSPETGIEIFSTKRVVERVTRPATEISLEEARQLAGDEVEIGDELQIPLSTTKKVVERVARRDTEISLEQARRIAGEDVNIGDLIQVPIVPEELGRIAAQTAKQVLLQKVRDAVRQNIYEQYIDRVGELVSGYVKRFERGDIIVDLGNVEAILPRSQQVRTEQWTQGERIRAVIHKVYSPKEAKGPQVELSRTSTELLRRLFEMEVPEIYDETVVIKGIVREPGERSKVAVASNERDVDPVGACVGMKGSRVQAIIRELRGEKIDIIEWSEEPSIFAANALSPAKVNQVRITDIERKKIEVIVDEDQLSLAIGKRGQNVRLAAQLVGWDIDIKSEAEIKREIARQMGAAMLAGTEVPLTSLEGVTPAIANILAERGIKDLETLAATSVDEISEYLDISFDEAQALIDSARNIIAARNEGATAQPSAEESGASASGPAEDREGEDPTARGYDEAVQTRPPFIAEEKIRAEDSADPVALTEADPMTVDELVLQEMDAGRDLRPDVIVPAPDITSSEAAVIERQAAAVEEERAAREAQVEESKDELSRSADE